MENKLEDLVESLTGLNDIISNANVNDGGFNAYGWDQVNLKKEQINYLIENQITKLNLLTNNPIPDGLTKTIDYHIESINNLTNNARSYLTNNAQHLAVFVPNLIVTLHTVFSDINFELFSYENVQANKLMPRALAQRLRSTEKSLDQLDETDATLKDKMSVIKDAHDAAESLPTDLASLKEAKSKLDSLIKEATEELNQTRDELESLKKITLDFKDQTEALCNEARLSKLNTESNERQSEKLVQQCDVALQVTTTEGLASGFDQKAKELRLSIWVWICGLLVALGSGAIIGADRVTVFTEVLANELTTGQAMLHTVMCVFSIGGPLWLAWISTQQINQRFKLSEDYSYKATVAKSFIGFKKFAERFEPETEARLFNSTLDRLDEMPLRLIQGKDYNSPWHEFVDSESFKNAAMLFPALATQAGIFANKTALKTKPKQPKPESLDSESEVSEKD
ncbi:hypothetical protein AB4237_22535 [Vibrio sp. 10N.261.55.F6]|uniref:hypothetical protein n=1 Tax=Vibrio sp. 10N.261.55.F6 TaxID=3229693 RepID=UPI00354E6787